MSGGLVIVPIGDGFEEEDLRAGGPNLCEAPCYSVPIPSDHRFYHALWIQGCYKPEIEEISRRHRVSTSDISYVGRRSRHDLNSEPVLTALLTTSRNNPTQHGWAQLAKDVWKLLRDSGIRPITVEVVDQRFNQAPYIFPCRETDEIYPVWEQVCKSILANINLRGIISIGCHRIGNASYQESCIPTVLVTVSRSCTRQWKPVREGILDVLTSYRLHMVAVFIRKDIGSLSSGVIETREIGSDECTATAREGMSISPHGLNRSQGTLGGCIELYNSRREEWVEFGLTCTHCVLPSEEEETLADWTKMGVRIGDVNAPRLLRVDCPSQRDIEDGIRVARETIMDIKEDPIFSKVDHAERIGDYTLKPFEQSEAHMSRYLESGNNVLGVVFAVSGLVERPARTASPNDGSLPTIRDWALVQPRAGRVLGSNEFSKHSKLELDKMEFLPVGERIRPGQLLYKWGRKTGATKGRYNGLRTAYISEEIVAGKVIKKPTLEHTVVSISRHDVFELEGDSGAFVYSNRGHVVGMCFGGFKDGYADDITRVTGVKDIRLKQ
ncbi:hypothetical protein BJX61DRAFT_532242 [Aspergillus egyptiacus]|nr:hypothetical protein BJX61DRAFT_532242 [Aspergillus egyptiacus]